MRVAVIGSGVAGLAAAWLLKRDHHVTLIERHTNIGMDALSVDVPGPSGNQRIDVPMRVVYENYYPNLTRLYRHAGVELEPLEYSGTFTHLGGETYLSYRNLRLGGVRFPMLRGRRAIHRETLAIVADAVRFFVTAGRDLRRGACDGVTLVEYLRAQRYSHAFAEQFLIPTMAGICTCTYAAVRSYPARVVVNYLASGLFLVPVKRASNGIRDVVNRLSDGVQQVRLGVTVSSVKANGASITVTGDGGYSESFDHVVMATQANHSVRMLQGTDAEKDALSCFRYESSNVIMHTDPSLAPPDKRLWGPVNFIVSREHDMPMATIWMNSVFPSLGSRDIFQTWNAIIEPRAEHVLSRVNVERPVVDDRSLKGLRLLDGLHRIPGRRVWFCGAYASAGIPLLESASSSALAVAAVIGGRHDWAPRNRGVA